jgi:AcrR family transcriptional regulator
MAWMGRWKPDAPGRLAAAALELYGERGYEQTTVEEIARRAGLTERTFFRHFTDKREVLFWGAGLLEEQLLRALDATPATLPPVAAIGVAFDAVANDFFGDRREYAARRQRIIAANPDLRERERIKLASLATAVAAALRLRGVGDVAAELAAETGVAVFRIAFERWVSDANQRTFPQLLAESFDELQSLVGTSAQRSR